MRCNRKIISHNNVYQAAESNKRFKILCSYETQVEKFLKVLKPFFVWKEHLRYGLNKIVRMFIILSQAIQYETHFFFYLVVFQRFFVRSEKQNRFYENDTFYCLKFLLFEVSFV